MSLIRVLILEDNPLDAELALASLEQGGIETQARRVETHEDFEAALAGEPADLILADYSLPSFDGITALELARKAWPQVPFLFVSGALGEELAIETLRRGATDYVLKHRLERLVPAVRRALNETRERAERQRAEEALRASEERLRLLLENAREFAIITLDPQGRVIDWNPGAERILGYRVEEIVGQSFGRFFLPEESGRAGAELTQARATGQAPDECWLVRKDGHRFWASGITTALRDASGHLRGFAKILRDLSERKGLEDQLRQRAEQLAEADRRKDEFLAMLAHELRNPLAPIRSAVEVMQQRGLEDPILVWACQVVGRQTDHLRHLVDDLLDISRITRGKITLRREPVELRQAVQQAVETTRPLIEARDHELTVSQPPEPLWLDADFTRLVQVLANLLNNAAKYTDPGGHIWLTVEQRTEGGLPGQAVVRVRDTGAGITPELLPRIFEPFIQADQSLARTQGGLGIGLTLVRRLVEMHGGSIEAHSAGPGTGSELVVLLPLRNSPPAEPRPPREQPSHSATNGASIPNQRILIIDDNVDAAQSLALLLQLRGHQVFLAHDGSRGVEIARAERPNVVILDIGLPKMDGYEVARRLRKIPELAGVLLIAVTGYGAPEDRQRTQAAGFDYHLIKPVDPTLLFEVLGHHAAAHASQ